MNHLYLRGYKPVEDDVLLRVSGAIAPHFPSAKGREPQLATKIRLRRMGTKKKPFYRVVVADSRAPVKGKYIEMLGRYNPRSEPPLIEIEEDRAIQWLLRGAQPSETVKSLFSQKGIMERAQAIKQGRQAPIIASAEPAETDSTGEQ